jgi:sugar/nucleoside kinase (ribokinase family)
MRNFFVTKHATLPIEMNANQLGGTLLHTCQRATAFCDAVTAIGVVGTEDIKEATKLLTQPGLRPRLVTRRGVSTGVCMLQYDDQRVRTGILSLRQANMTLEWDEIDVAEALATDMLCVNGWSFLPASTTADTLVRLLTTAHDAGVPIYFDVLPHHVQVDEMTPAYRAALALADIVACEVVPRQPQAHRRVDRTALPHLAPRCRLFIDFTWVDRITVVTRDGTCLHEADTGYISGTSPPGYLDGLALRLATTYFSPAT